eukprot:9946455-Heterocapsa_arctica.AAC.1
MFCKDIVDKTITKKGDKKGLKGDKKGAKGLGKGKHDRKPVPDFMVGAAARTPATTALPQGVAFCWAFHDPNGNGCDASCNKSHLCPKFVNGHGHLLPVVVGPATGRSHEADPLAANVSAATLRDDNSGPQGLSACVMNASAMTSARKDGTREATCTARGLSEEDALGPLRR